MATRSKRAETPDDDDNNTSLVRVSQQEAAQLRAIQLGQLPDPDTDALEEVEETAADRIARMLGDTGSDARAVVKLYKVKVEGQSFCQDYTVSQFENGGLNMVRKQWGPGEYKVMLYGTVPGTNRIALRARDTMTLEPLAETAVADVASTAANDRILLALEALAKRPEAPPVDPMAQMMQMLTMMKMMREATGADVKPEKTSIQEIMEAVREMKAVAGEINGEAKEEKSLMDMATPIIGLVQQAMAARQVPQPVEQGFPALSVPASMMGDAPPVNPQFNPDAPTEHVPAVEQPDEDMNALAMMLMMTHLKILVVQAKKGGDIEAGAEYVLDQLPDEMVDMLEHEQWWLMLTQAAPMVAPYQAWFTAVRDRALAILAAEDAANPEGDKPAAS